MKNIVILTACALTLGLTGCDNTAAVISQVQADVVAACGVEPTLASISALITSFNVAAETVDQAAIQVANAICKNFAVRYKKAGVPHGVPAPIQYRGVTIYFEPIKRNH